MRSLSLPYLGKFMIFISCAGVILPLKLNYIYVYIDMFVHHIMVSALISLCMLYNIIVDCTSFWKFVPYLPYVWVILPLYCRYILNFINFFVNVIYMFTEICWCTSYDMLLSFIPSWEACHEYFM